MRAGVFEFDGSVAGVDNPLDGVEAETDIRTTKNILELLYLL